MRRMCWTDDHFLRSISPFLVPHKQPPTGILESRKPTPAGQVPSEVPHGGVREEQSRKMQEAPDMQVARMAQGRRMIGISEVPTVADRLEQLVPDTTDYIDRLTLSRLGELFWLNDNPVENIAEYFKRIVFILMGRKLGGLTGQSTTEEGEARIDHLLNFLKLGVLNPRDLEKAIFAFSGHDGEAEAFFSYFLTRIMKSGLPWPRYRKNMHMDSDAAFSNENIVFSHDDVLEKYGDIDGPVLQIVCSTDFHIFALLIAHGACDGRAGSPLTPLLESKNTRGDRVAFLSAPNPYRNNWDPGVRCSQRIMDATFYFAQAMLNNLGSLLDRLDPDYSLRKTREGEKLSETISEARMRKLKRSQEHDGRYARCVYEKAVEVFELLPAAIEYIRQSQDWPERTGKDQWNNTSVGHRLAAIDQAITKLDIHHWKTGKAENGKYRGLFGGIVNDLHAAVDAGENVTFQQIDSIFQKIRGDIIEDIRWCGDPENR